MPVIEGAIGWYQNPGAPVNGTDEVQTITVTGSPTGGTYTLTFDGASHETAAIAFDAAASAVQTALRALSSIGATGCAVTGSAGGPYTVTFADVIGKKALPLIALANNSLTGGSSPSVSIAETTPGVDATARGAPTGALLIDTTNAKLYKNDGTPLDPNWNSVGDIGTAEIGAGALSADAAGRAIMATDYFDATTLLAKIAANAFTEANVDALFAAGAVDGADIVKAGSLGADRSASPPSHDAGTPMRNVLRVATDVVEAETVTIGADVFEVEIVNTDSTDNTQGGDFNNTTDPLTVTDAVTNYANITFTVGDLIRIENEILAVTAVVSNDVTFARGVSGTTAATHADAVDIFVGDGIAGPSTVALGLVTTLTPTVFLDALVDDINTRGSETMLATKISANEMLLVSADAVGGSAAPSATATATTETLAGANNAWASATMVDGKAAGARQLSMFNHTVLQGEVDLTAIRLVAPFNIGGFLVQVYDTNGLFKEDLTDNITIAASNRLEYDFTGATNAVAGDVMRVICWD